MPYLSTNNNEFWEKFLPLALKIFIAADTGPMHIAVAMKASTIALFGPTSKDITGPIGKGRYIVIHRDIGCEVPCYELACTDNKCLKAITVEGVLKAAEELVYS